jgi:hypothetical protein
MEGVISLFFYVHLMFHVCVQRFDGMDEKILGGEDLISPTVYNKKKIASILNTLKEN